MFPACVLTHTKSMDGHNKYNAEFMHVCPAFLNYILKLKVEKKIVKILNEYQLP